MSGIVAAIWHLILRSNLFYSNLYFHASGPFSFWFDYCLFKQPFTGSLKHRTWSNYLFDFFVFIYSVPQTSNRKKKEIANRNNQISSFVNGQS